MNTPLKQLLENKPIAIDLETFDPELKLLGPGFVTGVGYVVGVALAWEGYSTYIPIQHAEGFNYPKQDVIDYLNQLLSNPHNLKIFHNAQYDLGWLRHLGVQVHGEIFDTMLAAPLLDENRFSYSLDSLGKDYLNEGKFEEALKLAVIEKYKDTKTRKARIVLRDDLLSKDYSPIIEARQRIEPLYDLWTQEIKDKYIFLGYDDEAPSKLSFTKKDRTKTLLWSLPYDDLGSYPQQDAELTYRLYELFVKELEAQDLTELAKLEFDLVPVLIDMRTQGVRLDIDKAIELDKKYTLILDDIQKRLNEKAGEVVNVDADTELIKFCEKRGIKYAKTEKGNASFTADNIPKDDSGFFELVLEMRKYNKARNTYIRGYILGKSINGRLHGQYNQLKSDDTGTVTGRLSSSDPNMQNLPSPVRSQIGKDIRSIFIPDDDKQLWLCADYSGQEPRMLVHTVLNIEEVFGTLKSRTNGVTYTDSMCLLPGSDLAKTEEFRGRDADFHTAVSGYCMTEQFKLEGRQIGTVDFNKAVASFRPKAKSIGLGVMYGSGDARVAEEMTKKGSPMTVEEARAIRDSIYNNVPFLKSLNDLLMNKAKTRGYILTVLKRRGRFHMWECPIMDKVMRKKHGMKLFKTQEEALAYYRANVREMPFLNRPQRAFTYKALNKLIQGSSADQTKTAMVRLYQRNNPSLSTLDIFYSRIKGFKPVALRIQVHDEINCSIDAEEDVSWYQYVMETCLLLKVEVKAEPHTAKNWAEAK